MTALQIISLVFKILPYAVSVVGVALSAHYRRKYKDEKKRADSLASYVRLNKKIEKKKTDIREKQNEKENDIISDPGSDHGVVPVSAKGKHNHAFHDPCGEGCPSYNPDGRIH